MDESQVLSFLESGEDGGEVDKLAAQAREDGISSVPTVEIGGRRIEGAEDASEFFEALITAKEAASNGSDEV